MGRRSFGTRDAAAEFGGLLRGLSRTPRKSRAKCAPRIRHVASGYGTGARVVSAGRRAFFSSGGVQRDQPCTIGRSCAISLIIRCSHIRFDAEFDVGKWTPHSGVAPALQVGGPRLFGYCRPGFASCGRAATITSANAPHASTGRGAAAESARFMRFSD